MKMILQGLRVAFVFCLYFLTLACYLVPILTAKYWGSRSLAATSPSKANILNKSKQLGLRFISLCNCTAAGIFLGMCFLGLFPYVEEKFDTIFRTVKYNPGFPVPEAIAVMGFFITLTAEQMLVSWRERKDVNSQDDLEQGQGLLDECEMQELSDDTSLAQDQSQKLVNDKPSVAHQNLQHTNCPDQNYASPTTSSGMSSSQSNHGHSHLSVLLVKENGFSFFILALATSMHSVFEGLTLGLQRDVPKAIHLFIAIIIHECLVAMALGVNSTRLKYSFMTYVKFAILFSATIPLGLLLGVIIERTPGLVGEIVSAVLQGLAAGVFLHVTFQDFLPSEFSNKQDRLLKVFFFFMGFLILAVVTYFLNDK